MSETVVEFEKTHLQFVVAVILWCCTLNRSMDGGFAIVLYSI